MRVAAELGQHAMGAVEQPQPRQRSAPREHLVGHPGRLQHPEHLVVQVHGPGQGIGLGVLLDDEHLEPSPGEEQRRRQADRSRAHDDDGGLGHPASVTERRRTLHGTRSGCRQRCTPLSTV